MIVVTIALGVIVVCLTWGYFRWHYSYWSSKGINGPSPTPLLGHALRLFDGERWTFVNENYKIYKEERMFGLYEWLNPNLFICDLNMIRDVLVKDFDSFLDRRVFKLGGKGEEHMNEMLSFLNGDEWKRLRSTMSPTFSSGKLKQMFSIVHEQAKNFVIHCENKLKTSPSIDVKKSFGSFTMDVIAASAFGIQSSSLLNKNPIFANKAEEFFSTSLTRKIKNLILFTLPAVSSLLGLSFLNDPFFKQVTEETVAQRRRDKIRHNDFLDLLLDEQAKQKEHFDENKDYRITDQTILAESILFLIAGYDTTANALTFTASYLSKHPECQNRLRKELQDLKETGNFDYHGIMEAKYLNGCVSETLRLIPPLPWLERKCTKDYKLSDSNITITKDMIVSVPVWGLHRDPTYWPEPDEYQPERFLPENKSNIIPFTYLPFGAGPRNCIAMRFALMEAKICIAELILNYKVEFAPGYGKIKLENGGGVIRPAENSMVLKFKKV